MSLIPPCLVLPAADWLDHRSPGHQDQRDPAGVGRADQDRQSDRRHQRSARHHHRHAGRHQPGSVSDHVMVSILEVYAAKTLTVTTGFSVKDDKRDDQSLVSSVFNYGNNFHYFIIKFSFFVSLWPTESWRQTIGRLTEGRSFPIGRRCSFVKSSFTSMWRQLSVLVVPFSVFSDFFSVFFSKWQQATELKPLSVQARCRCCQENRAAAWPAVNASSGRGHVWVAVSETEKRFLVNSAVSLCDQINKENSDEKCPPRLPTSRVRRQPIARLAWSFSH